MLKWMVMRNNGEQVVDAAGVTVHDSTVNITFSVAAGASVRVVGCGNGDPANHDPNHAPWKPAYHGLVRAIIKTTVRATGSAASRKLEALVNPDAGRGAFSSAIDVSGTAGTDLPASFAVVAESRGLSRATLEVPLSVNPADDPTEGCCR